MGRRCFYIFNLNYLNKVIFYIFLDFIGLRKCEIFDIFILVFLYIEEIFFKSK